MLPADEKQLLIDRINSADSKERLEVVVSLIPLQPNGCRYQIANVLDDAFWYTNYSEIKLDALKSWMLERVECYA